MSRQSRRIFTRIGLLATILTPWRFVRADDRPNQDGPELGLKELNEALGDLRKKYDRLTHNLNVHSLFDPPIGAVLAFAGSWPPINPATGAERTERELGWALCDGRSFDHETLKAIQTELTEGLGRVLATSGSPTTKLPDYRGYFLRGFDGSGSIDRGKFVNPSTRQPRGFGSIQQDTTSLPHETTFITSNQSANPTFARYIWRHHFVFQTSDKESASYFDGVEKPQVEGDHHHDVNAGGDAETRPVNVAVHYIIKFRSSRDQ
jgi:hypothetical protein